MKKLAIINKKEGQTPLEALEILRRKNKKYKDIKMTYAGRLDPMASGVLIVLLGDEVKNKEKYLKLDKEYEFEILFGISTDTYDILGKVSQHSHILKNVGMSELEKSIKNNLKYFTGKFVQQYPVYSSKTVKGKQLWEYGRDGSEVELPERQVEVKKIKFLKIKKVSTHKLLASIEKRVKKVNGDFRQEEILEIWRGELGNKKSNYFIGSFKVKCGSGMYVRGIAHSLGEKLGTGALAFSIKRTKVGKFVKISG